jgi:hypothetical protein
MKKASVGAVGLGFGGTSQLLTAGGNEVEITVVNNENGPDLTKRVDADWYQYEKHVEGVKQDAAEELLSNSGVKAVGIGSGLAQEGGRSAGHLRVYVDEDLSAAAIDSYQSIPVERIERQESVNMACDCNTDAGSIAYGGERSLFPISQTEASAGSLGCEVTYNDSKYMLTAYHNFTSSCGDDIGGRTAYQDFNDDYFAYVPDGSDTYFDGVQDWALLARNENGPVDDFNNYIADYRGKLSGNVTKDGLMDYMCSSDGTVYKQGFKTCKDQGCVVDRDKTTRNADCTSGSSDGFIEYDGIRSEPGDSGGILFRQFTFNGCYYTAPIGLINQGPDNAANNCTADKKPATTSLTGISAYKLNNQYGIGFSPEFEQGC